MEVLGLDKLSVVERLQLTTEQMAELARRLADAEANPGDAVPWKTVRAEMTGKLRR